MKPSDLVAKAQTTFGQFLGKDDVVFQALKDVLLEMERSVIPSYTYTTFKQELYQEPLILLPRGLTVINLFYKQTDEDYTSDLTIGYLPEIEVGVPLLKTDVKSVLNLGSRNNPPYMFAEHFDNGSGSAGGGGLS